MRGLHLLAIFSLSLGSILHGYTFNFINFMFGPCKVRIKLSGDESWYYGILQEKSASNNANQFSFNVNIGSSLFTNSSMNATTATQRKINLCLSQIQVSPYEKQNDTWVETNIWYNVNPYLLKVDDFKSILTIVNRFISMKNNSFLRTLLIIQLQNKNPQLIKDIQSLNNATLYTIVSSIGTLRQSFCKDKIFCILPNIDFSGAEIKDPIIITSS